YLSSLGTVALAFTLWLLLNKLLHGGSEFEPRLASFSLALPTRSVLFCDVLKTCTRSGSLCEVVWLTCARSVSCSVKSCGGPVPDLFRSVKTCCRPERDLCCSVKKTCGPKPDLSGLSKDLCEPEPDLISVTMEAFQLKICK